MTLEQARRLKEAGFPLKRCPYYHSPSGECEGLQVKCPENTDDDCWFKTEEKEMMEFLRDHIYQIQTNVIESRWQIQICAGERTLVINHDDLTEALVQACVKVLEGREGK